MSDHRTNHFYDVVEKSKHGDEVELLGLLNNASNPKCLCTFFSFIEGQSESRSQHTLCLGKNIQQPEGQKLLLSPLRVTESPCFCFNNKHKTGCPQK